MVEDLWVFSRIILDIRRGCIKFASEKNAFDMNSIEILNYN